jgi:hypothetical protein
VRSRILAFVLAPSLLAMLAIPATPARAQLIAEPPPAERVLHPPHVAVYAMRLDPGAPLRKGSWNSGYGGGFDVSWPVMRTQGLLALVGGAEASSFYSGVRTEVDTASGERAEHHMDQLYGRVFVGGELGPHGDGTLEPYANLALSMIAYGYYDDIQLTAGDASRELLVSQHEVAAGWSAGAGVNLNFRGFGMTGGVRYLRQFGTPQQLGNGTVRVEPAYMQYRLGVTVPFPIEP